MKTKEQIAHEIRVERASEAWKQRVREVKAWREGRGPRPWWLGL
jgi:hypothetical protein